PDLTNQTVTLKTRLPHQKTLAPSPKRPPQSRPRRLLALRHRGGWVWAPDSRAAQPRPLLAVPRQRRLAAPGCQASRAPPQLHPRTPPALTPHPGPRTPPELLPVRSLQTPLSRRPCWAARLASGGLSGP